MKKLLCALLALMLALGCTAIAEDADFDYTGQWVLTGGIVAGVTVDLATLEAAVETELDMDMLLYADGICALTAGGATEEGTWTVTENGVQVVDAGLTVIEFTLVDGKLVQVGENTQLIFARADETYAMPLTGMTLADFNGEWALSYVEYAGMMLDAETLGLTIDITLEDGEGKAVIETAESTTNIDAFCEVVEIDQMGSVLYFVFLDENGEQTETYMMLLLFDNGELVWYSIEDEMEVFYCFLPAEELAEEAAEEAAE